MDMDNNSGQMEQNMKASGKITKLMDRELSGMFMGISTRANGNVIKLMVSVSTRI